MSAADNVERWLTGLSRYPEIKNVLSDFGSGTLNRVDVEKLIANSRRLEDLETTPLPDLEYAIALPPEDYSYEAGRTHFTIGDDDLADVERRLKEYKKDFPHAYLAKRFKTGEYTRAYHLPEPDYDDRDEHYW